MKSKRNKRIRIILIVLAVFILISGGATVGVGNYFINYALVPAGDGGDREESDNPLQSKEVKEIIETNEDIALEKIEQWKESTEQEDVFVTAEDGVMLRGTEYYTDRTSNKWVILVHGYRSTTDRVLMVGQNLAEEGYNVLSINMRAHGESEGDYIGMGWLDRLDLLQWIDLIVKENPKAEIVLHGTSMGGATVMMASGETLPENVKAIVEDCGYTSVWDIFSSEIKVRFNLPEFPVMNMVSFMTDMKAGYNFKEASALKQVAKSETPILFIHGDADDFVPVSMVYELYDAAECQKEIYIVEGASHSEAKYVDPDSYYSKVESFLNEYVK